MMHQSSDQTSHKLFTPAYTSRVINVCKILTNIPFQHCDSDQWFQVVGALQVVTMVQTHLMKILQSVL